MMPDPVHNGKARQFVAASTKDTLIVAPANIEFPSPLRHMAIVLQVRFDRDGLHARQVPNNVAAETDQSSRPERETFFLAGLLHFTGAAVGFLMGGPAGAAFGSVIGERVGAAATQQSNIIFKRVLKWGAFAARHPDSLRVQAGEGTDGNPHNLRR
jgi:hypothetical protein